VPFTFSQVASSKLAVADRCIADLREAPVSNRSTKFRLAQQNMIQYTFGSLVPGFAVGSGNLNVMPYQAIVNRPLENAVFEGTLLYGDDFDVKSSAVAKVTGDIFEVVSSAVLWNTAARWNTYMAGGKWPTNPRYARPSLKPALTRQVAALNLPRNYDWVKLLVEPAQEKIAELRDLLAQRGMGLPTSTPDLAVVALPAEYRDDVAWRTELPGLSRDNQTVLSDAHKLLAGKVEPEQILLAVAFKVSLRSDRLYQPLYEANIMQLLLEGMLGGLGWSSRFILSTGRALTPSRLTRPHRCLALLLAGLTFTGRSVSFTSLPRQLILSSACWASWENGWYWSAREARWPQKRVPDVWGVVSPAGGCGSLGRGKTSGAVKLSSCVGEFGGGVGEGGVLVAVLAGGQAVVQAAEEASE
jgi:hypothetical protein